MFKIIKFTFKEIKKCPFCKTKVVNGGPFIVYFNKIRWCSSCDDKVSFLVIVVAPLAFLAWILS